MIPQRVQTMRLSRTARRYHTHTIGMYPTTERFNSSQSARRSLRWRTAAAITATSILTATDAAAADRAAAALDELSIEQD
jgi:hypothetical protein